MQLHERILQVLHDEIGPSAPILLDRCCNRHLNKKSVDITGDDLSALSDFCSNSVRANLGTSHAKRIKKNILNIRV